MPSEDKRHRSRFEQEAAEAAEQRNELHLASHEQHRLTTASIIENGIKAERNKFVYEVSAFCLINLMDQFAYWTRVRQSILRALRINMMIDYCQSACWIHF